MAPLRRIWQLIVAGVALVFSRRREPREAGADEGLVEREVGAPRRAELAVAGLLAGAALAASAFVVVYVVGVDTQLLGLTFGLGLLALAAAAIIAARALVPREERVEERPEFTDPEARPVAERESGELHDVVADGGDGITRRRLLGTAAGAAGAAMGAAIVVPIASLGPTVGDRLEESPWADGVPLVDENGLAVLAGHLETGSFLTAFAEGSDRARLASSLVVVRVEEGKLSLPPERTDWAPKGILAFSKICTHAGCAVNLFRSPLYPPRTPGPALVCPCHYSTFDVLKGGDVVFGPAGRPLPQLPLRIGSRGDLIAAGPLSGNVGPSWSGVREP
jgi:ubiquinol-cytochrome c reductase iron-sulfur subunit